MGMGIAKLTYNDDIMGGCPDFVSVSPYDVIVPIDTESYREPERICHVVRLTEREVLDRGLTKGWKNVHELLRLAKNGAEPDRGDESRIDVGVSRSPADGRYYVFWEIYYWRRIGDGGLFGNDQALSEDVAGLYSGAERWKTIMSPDFPSLEILDTPYPFQWPFVQFRNEGRSTKWYDTRGLGHMLVDEQIAATAARNANANALELFGSPMFKGNQNMNAGNIRVAPGAILGDVEPIPMPQSPQQFAYEEERAIGRAQKRAGVYSQGLTSPLAAKAGEAKTATEIQSSEGVANMYSASAVAAFNEPLAKLFSMLWRALSKDGKAFTFPLNGGVGEMPTAAYGAEFDLIPAGTSQTANPSRYYQQLVSLTGMLVNFPNVKAQNIPRVLISAINPQLEPLLVQDTDEPAPIIQQVGALSSALAEVGEVVKNLAAGSERNDRAVGALKEAVMRISEKVGGANAITP